jgi:hypothetical protein
MHESLPGAGVCVSVRRGAEVHRGGRDGGWVAREQGLRGHGEGGVEGVGGREDGECVGGG